MRYFLETRNPSSRAALFMSALSSRIQPASPRGMPCFTEFSHVRWYSTASMARPRNSGITPSSMTRARSILREYHRTLRMPGNQPSRAVVQQRQIEIGQTHRKSHDFAATLGENDEVRHDDRLQLLREMIDLGVGERDEAPVLFPRAVVELLDELHLVVKPLHVERSEER